MTSIVNIHWFKFGKRCSKKYRCASHTDANLMKEQLEKASKCFVFIEPETLPARNEIFERDAKRLIKRFRIPPAEEEEKGVSESLRKGPGRPLTKRHNFPKRKRGDAVQDEEEGDAIDNAFKKQKSDVLLALSTIEMARHGFEFIPDGEKKSFCSTRFCIGRPKIRRQFAGVGWKQFCQRCGEASMKAFEESAKLVKDKPVAAIKPLRFGFEKITSNYNFVCEKKHDGDMCRNKATIRQQRGSSCLFNYFCEKCYDEIDKEETEKAAKAKPTDRPTDDVESEESDLEKDE